MKFAIDSHGPLKMPSLRRPLTFLPVQPRGQKFYFTRNMYDIDWAHSFSLDCSLVAFWKLHEISSSVTFKTKFIFFDTVVERALRISRLSTYCSFFVLYYGRIMNTAASWGLMRLLVLLLLLCMFSLAWQDISSRKKKKFYSS